jgi:hypothetical protein
MLKTHSLICVIAFACSGLLLAQAFTVNSLRTELLEQKVKVSCYEAGVIVLKEKFNITTLEIIGIVCAKP